MRRAQAVPVVLLLVFAAGAYRLKVHREAAGDSVAAGAAEVAEESAPLPASGFAPRVFGGHRLEPRADVVLLGAGQSEEQSFAAFARVVAPKQPMLMMRYVDLRDDVSKFFAELRRDLDAHKEFLVPQIGVALNSGEAARHYEAETARGVDDARIAQLCDGLRALQRPVFLRPGYEFNGPWNGYAAPQYVAAFRKMADAVHVCTAEVAVVWDWSPDAELDQERAGAPAQYAQARWEEFYPGDAYVDWWGVNLFSERSIHSAATRAFLADAAKKKFPVMVAEATLRDARIADTRDAIDGWFAPFFALVRRSPAVRAVCYIDWDWRRYPQWAAWGDARVESNAEVAAYVRTQVNDGVFAGARDRVGTMELLRVTEAGRPR